MDFKPSTLAPRRRRYPHPRLLLVVSAAIGAVALGTWGLVGHSPAAQSSPPVANVQPAKAAPAEPAQTATLVTRPIALPGQRERQEADTTESVKTRPAPPPTDQTQAAAQDAPIAQAATSTLEVTPTPPAESATLLLAAAPAAVAAIEGDPIEARPAPMATKELTLTVQRGDSLDRLFRRHGLSVGDLHQMLRLDEAAQALRVVRPGDEIRIRREGASVLALTRRLDDFRLLEVGRAQGGYEAAVSIDAPERRVTHAHGRITSSLFNAGKAAGISDNLVMALAGIFAWDIDFVLDIREGDEFLVLYEELWRDGKKLRDGAILAAEFVNTGDRYQALRYVSPEGRADYFTPDGLSLRKAFLRAPVDFSRISSNFNPNRRHPILNTIRAHRGVDYAAPAGTPVKAAGDGKVSFRGGKSGYGNTVILQHGDNITTLYAHLSRFASYKRGARVRQGDVIGYVGKTGLASGNHLHYEYRIAGVHRNPRTVPLPKADPVPEALRADFDAHAEHVMAQLQLIRNVRLAAASGELVSDAALD